MFILHTYTLFMQKYSIAILLILFLIISGCKKDNQRIATPTYQLDSVKLEFLDTSGAISTYVTIPVTQAFLDTFISQNNYPGSDYAGFYVSNDSVIYVNHPEFYDLSRAILYNKRPFECHNFKPYGSFAQDGYDRQDIYFNYDATGKLNTMNYLLKYHTAYPNFSDSDYLLKRQLNFYYAGNNLTDVTDNAIRYNYHQYDTGYDSIIYPANNVGTFSYSSNLTNQNNMIGIDLNDLIFNDIIGANMNDGLNFGYFIFILHQRLSYNIKCTSLIEHFQYKVYYQYFNQYITYNNNVQYTFDTTKNNRVIKMSITDLSGAGKQYTFYYKD